MIENINKRDLWKLHSSRPAQYHSWICDTINLLINEVNELEEKQDCYRKTCFDCRYLNQCDNVDKPNKACPSHKEVIEQSLPTEEKGCEDLIKKWENAKTEKNNCHNTTGLFYIEEFIRDLKLLTPQTTR